MASDLQSGAPATALAARPKVFGPFSMVLFSVSAILVADTEASSAAMGVQGLGFWIILGLLLAALLVLRRKFPDQPRPYTAPGGAAGAWISTILCEAGIGLTLFLFFYFPMEGASKGAFWAITGGGTIISLFVGWWLYWQASRSVKAGPAPTDSGGRS
jgi:hypothetical protein